MTDERWTTFDCYGTLVDWEGGLRAAYTSVWPDLDADRALHLHHAVEPLAQEHGELSYREVLARCLRAVAAIEGVEIPPGEEDALADSLPSWPPFEEVPGALRELRERGWRLVILSNTDPELLATSVEAIGVPFDATITAAEAGSYKPAPGHWQRFFADTGAARDRHVHVGASIFHDIAPAARMDMPVIWINRLGEDSDTPRSAELPDLSRLAETLDEIAS
jgi:2-haloacid dehalogenase